MRSFKSTCHSAGALGLATALSGALLLGSPAAAIGADAEQPSTSERSSVPEQSATPEHTSTPDGLATALERDLQLSPAEFDARGDLAAAAADALPELRQIDGFAGIALSSGSPARLLIAGTGPEIEQAAADLNAKIVDPGSLDESLTQRLTGAEQPAEPPEPQPADTRMPAPSSAETASAPAPAPSSTTSAPTPTGATSDSPSHDVAPPSDVAPATVTPKTATSARTLLKEYIERYGRSALSRLQSIMRTADGSFVIRMDTSSGRLQTPGAATVTKPEQHSQVQPNFSVGYTNVDIAPADGPAKPLGDPLVGGLGTLSHAAGYAVSCSVGFNAYSPTGEPAAISAGHCTMDGTYKDVSLTDPTTDRAASPGASNPANPVRWEKLEMPMPLAELGTYTFSQFGGPGNTPGTAPEDGKPATNIGTDVSVISVANEDLNQLPAVTDWGHPAEPAISGPLVLGTSRPIIGAPVCKSGRTTGWTCGEVDAIGIFLVADPDNATTGREDVRIVQGFGSFDLYSAGGDSGGAMISGNHALGVVSAGTGEAGSSTTTFGASIGPMLEATNGYTLQVFVSTPKLRSQHNGGTVETSEMVRGIAPAGSNVKITSGGQTLDVKVRPGGRWRFRAPETPGVFTFKAVASKGFSTSETGTYRLIVEQPPPPPKQDPGGAGNQEQGTGQQPDPDTEVAPAAGHTEPLADTGAAGDPFTFALFGGGLLAVGSALLLIRRRYTNSC